MEVKRISNLHLIFGIFWVLLLAIDIWLSLSSGIKPPCEFEQSDKFYHMGMYFFLALLPFMYSIKITNATFLSLVSLAIGIILEYMQFFVPFREFSIMDICANEVGILLGIIVGVRIRGSIWQRNNLCIIFVTFLIQILTIRI